MTNSEYKRGYGRGYNTSIRRVQEIRRKYSAAFQRLRDLTSSGYGNCEQCSFWRREVNCKWGFCDMTRANEQHPDWPAPWAHIDCWKPACGGPSRLCTHAQFGCVNFTRATP